MIKNLFNQINYDIFANELDYPIFVTHYEPETMGYFIEWEGMEVISILADLSYFDGSTTIAHEMIHLWQYENGFKLNHGYRFRKMARIIEKFYNLKKGNI